MIVYERNKSLNFIPFKPYVFCKHNISMFENFFGRRNNLETVLA